jgi:hypothetical protein
VELTLNLLWAGIAATLLGLWVAPRFVRPEKYRAGIALLALLCVICVLFPIVSMSDDLSASPADPETVKSKQAMLPHFLLAGSAWILVYDPHALAFRHEISAPPDFAPPAHSFLSFFVTRRPPPQTA